MEIVQLTQETEQACLFQAVKILKSGGVVVFPTDTVYGLAAGIDNESALEKIFVIKSRPKEKPLSVFAPSVEGVNSIAYVADSRVQKFLQEIWPGKITCVLPARGWVSQSILSRPNNDILHAKQGYGIGVRIPEHPFTLQVVRAYNAGITGTSANVTGRGPYTDSKDVIREFSKFPFQPDLIIDAGKLPDSIPSTVIDCTTWPPVTLREGAVKKEEYQPFLYAGGRNA
ncbi:MAG: threonylcarbamoyl-AMP synthase [Candidatus Niyogibacteria bacterium CG10_big_fil_rev_8_21_14_0_10_46_36]|uniref:L-threonylcarbamoyladenylate synthase n=1 Tax=Candidatus Niyogibacteria bacterium CG10_big_fil_rev_8_21_14_0_10_46_36 TaxID=1974726 RepID=A0A2H0TD12_9BACT|nr:MAG: threonylcarbamoyl-AMP synthase [Candidatus Niyogibacteria bacterium CG10_big_fil_rev_8_21_14_0_10_46_36]